jgi:hypothetical protein
MSLLEVLCVVFTAKSHWRRMHRIADSSAATSACLDVYYYLIKSERLQPGHVTIGQIELNAKLTLAFTCKKCDTRSLYQVHAHPKMHACIYLNHLFYMQINTKIC